MDIGASLLIQFMALVIAGMGTALIVNPETSQRLTQFLEKGNRLRFAAAIEILFGMIFFSVSSHGRLPFLLVLFGIWFICEGTSVFWMGKERAVGLLRWWSEMSSNTQRGWGALLLCLSVLMGLSL